jgi:phosphatidylinositol dimannoside acyltransferase
MAGQPVAAPTGYGSRSAQSTSPAEHVPLCTVNDLLWFLYLYPLRLLSAVSPRALLYRIGRLAEPLVQFHWRRRREKAISWIVSACCCTPDQAARIARQSISNNMLRILDDLLLLRPSRGQVVPNANIKGIEHLERALSAGKGVILLTGHFCANRIAEKYLASCSYPMLSVHNQRPSNKAAGRLGRRFLQPRYIELQRRANPDVVYMQDAECSLKIFRRLRSGGLVNLQLDGLAATRAVEGTFLGVSWRFGSGIFELTRLSGCAVVPMLCLGGGSELQIRFSPMLAVVRANSAGEFLANLPVFTQAVEKLIVGQPEEWRLWTHF